MRRIAEQLAEWWALAGGALLLVIVAGTAWHVGGSALDRVVQPLGGSVAALAGYEDFLTYAISAAALMLFPYCQVRGGHVAVDFLADRLPPKVQAVTERGFALALALVIGFLLVAMAQGMVQSRADYLVAPILGWPQWPFFMPGLVSLALWFVLVALDAVAPKPRR